MVQVLILFCFFTARDRSNSKWSDSSSSSSKISSSHMLGILENLKQQCNRRSTYQTYHRIWQSFNKFLIRLDSMPRSWEDRAMLFCAHLIDSGHQLSTVKSYVSAIKSMVSLVNCRWNDDKILLTSITRACKLRNDRVKCRFPIHISLLEQILFELERLSNGAQPYLESLYKVIFILGYYGLLRVGELAQSKHVLKARDIHVGKNKPKILLSLHSSKTHGVSSHPQEIKITAVHNCYRHFARHFCPFKLIRHFLQIRGGYTNEQEQFFIFKDKSPVKPNHIRSMLRQLLSWLNLEAHLYDCHSMHARRASDMVMLGYTVEQVKK